MRALVTTSIDMWTAFSQTLQKGIDPIMFCACVRSSLPMLKVLGRVTRPLRKAMLEDVALLDTVANETACTALGTMSPEDAPDPRVESAIMWCKLGLTFAVTVAREFEESVFTTTQIVKSAYDDTLAAHHSHPMNMVFRTACDLMPRREKIRKRVGGNGADDMFGTWASVVDPCLLHVNIMIRERGWVLGVSDREFVPEQELLDVDGDSD